MERGVFPRPEIEARLRRFVLVRLMVDDDIHPEARSKEWNLLLHQDFRTGSIPRYAVYRADRTVVGSTDFPGGSMDAYAVRMAAWLDDMLAKVPK